MTSTPPPKAPGRSAVRRFTLLALPTAALAAWAFYYLDHLPISGQVEGDRPWSVGESQGLLLVDPAPGPLLSITERKNPVIQVTVDPGATINAPGRASLAQAYPGLSPAWPVDRDGRTSVRIFRAPAQSASIDIALAKGAPEGGEPPDVWIEPRHEAPSVPVLNISSRGATLDVSISLDTGSDAGSITVGNDPPTALLQNLSISAPPGRVVRIAMHEASDYAAELGDIPEGQLPPARLDVRAVAVGKIIQGRFTRTWIACGSKDGRVLWRRPFPAIHLSDCEPGHVTAANLLGGKGLTLDVQGEGFLEQDRQTVVWGGLRWLHNNDVLKAILTTLIGSLTGWLAAAFGARKKGAG